MPVVKLGSILEYKGKEFAVIGIHKKGLTLYNKKHGRQTISLGKAESLKVLS